jgi:D-alanyl-lipoteichoic acid acyltransferase DltB (MBOAT superfamily)
MLYNSYAFLVGFLPIVLVVYFGLAARVGPKASLGWLTLASLGFYAWWNPPYVALIALSILANFALGHTLGVLARGEHARSRFWLTTVGIALNLTLLGYYKYAHFFVETFDALTGAQFVLGQVILPLGISFFTFEQIGYLVDAYGNRARPYTFIEYTFFVTFFPHLIAGPIIVHHELIGQIDGARRFLFNPQNFATGLTLFVIGLAKKVLVADTFANHSSHGFAEAAAGSTPHLLAAWLGIMAYALQLYFDFSGYSDMGLGLARMLNFKLPLNFDSPYKAVNIIDFWRRWHMTLSRFLRDMLYIPLGGNRHGTARKHLNLFITMLLGGLWHGAGWTFIVWGALHGGYLVVNHTWRSLGKKELHEALDANPLARQVSTLVTFLAVLVGWVFFRAAGFEPAVHMLKGMLNLGQPVPAEGWTLLGTPLMLCALGYLAVRTLPNSQEVLGRFEPALGAIRQKPALHWGLHSGWALITAVLAWASVLNITKVSEFLYFQF